MNLNEPNRHDRIGIWRDHDVVEGKDLWYGSNPSRSIPDVECSVAAVDADSVELTSTPETNGCHDVRLQDAALYLFNRRTLARSITPVTSVGDAASGYSE